jgi:uncharacterized protein (DUF302 family)
MPGDRSEIGIISVPSQHSVDDTVNRLRRLLQAKAAHVFAIVDHSGEAEKVGLHMPNTKLIIFGSPQAGTSLMLAAPTIAIDLPLKLLVWEDRDAKVWITYNSPQFLRDRHNLPSDLIPTLAVAGALAHEVADTHPIPAPAT